MKYFLLTATDDAFIMWLAIIVISPIITYFFLRWTLSVNKRVKLMEAQIKILVRIAVNAGVSKDELQEIIKDL